MKGQRNKSDTKEKVSEATNIGQTNKAFNAGARMSLFQVLGVNATSTPCVALTGGNEHSISDTTSSNQDPVVTSNRGRGSNGRKQQKETNIKDCSVVESSSNVLQRVSRSNGTKTGRVVSLVQQPAQPQPTLHNITKRRGDKKDVSSLVVTAQDGVLQRARIASQSGENSSRRKNQRSSTVPSPPPVQASTQAVTAPISAAVPGDEKPIPMLLQILAAAKAKSEQRRAEAQSVAAAHSLPSRAASPPIAATQQTNPVVPVTSFSGECSNGDRQKRNRVHEHSSQSAAGAVQQAAVPEKDQKKHQEKALKPAPPASYAPESAPLNLSSSADSVRNVGTSVSADLAEPDCEQPGGSMQPASNAKGAPSHAEESDFNMAHKFGGFTSVAHALLNRQAGAQVEEDDCDSDVSYDLLLREATRSCAEVGSGLPTEEEVGEVAEARFSVGADAFRAATASPSSACSYDHAPGASAHMFARLSPSPLLGVSAFAPAAFHDGGDWSSLSVPAPASTAQQGHLLPPGLIRKAEMPSASFTPVDKLVPNVEPEASTANIVTASEQSVMPDTSTSEPQLPVDEHREKILQSVRANSITIINGMTGCGKSTRIPVMLLEDSRRPPVDGTEQGGGEAYVMVSQPRRIAATALKNRLAQTLGSQIGLRLGKGHKEESADTRIWFVTTGYLVRLLAHRVQAFARFTHLVIDEIHERSLDCDLLCYLARRLLHVYPHIKIVLMSATAHSAMFQTYFNSSQEAIFVGVRRFPMQEHFAEDLFPLLPVSAQKALARLLESTARCSRRNLEEVVPDAVVKDQLVVAAALARSIVQPGGAVLVFVSGMADITELMEILTTAIQQQGAKRGTNDTTKTQLLAVHSDIPHEQQLLAFQPSKPDELKIVIATNAAESSVTIPDVDHVICLGTSKVMTFSARQRTTQLINTWISKASATQRAGRTGRVRPGSVYRVYGRGLYELMADYEVSEVHRQPMTEVALHLKAMLSRIRGVENGSTMSNQNAQGTDKFRHDSLSDSSDEEDGDACGDLDITCLRRQRAKMAIPELPGVTAVLRALIEPPSLTSIEDALCTLYECGMLTAPDDASSLTEIGALAAELPVDFLLGRFLAYAVLLGVAREAVVIAAALGSAKSPFRTPNQLVQTDTDEFNSHCRQLFLAMARLDRGLVSEPLMLVQAYWEWQRLSTDRDKFTWCKENCIVPTRMRQLHFGAQNLYSTMFAKLAGCASTAATSFRSSTAGRALAVDDQRCKDSLICLPPLSHRTANALRLSLLWAFPHQLLRQKTILASEEQMRTVDLPQLSVNASALRAFFSGHFSVTASREFSTQHQDALSLDFNIVSQGKRTYVADLLDRSFESLVDSFLSLLGELEADVAWLTSSFSKPDSLLIVFDPTAAEAKLLPYLEALFGRDLVRMNSGSVERAIFKAVINQRSQLTRLNEVFSEQKWRIFSWDIPASGSASLVCANCVPTDRQIRQLFLGRDLASRIASADLAESEARWRKWSYQSKISRSKLKVLFSEDAPTAFSNGGYITVSESDNTTAASSDIKLHRLETIRNIPLALQLANFVRFNSNTDRQLRLTVPERSGSDPCGDDDWNEPSRPAAYRAPGSRQDARLQSQQGSVYSPGPSSTSIRMNSVYSEWTKLPTAALSSGNDDSASNSSTAGQKVSFSSYSLQRVAQHMGNEAVYALSYSLMALSANNAGHSDVILRAEGITMLPVGSQWLSLALACVSRLDVKVLRTFKDGCKLSPRECHFAERISNYLSQCSVRYCFQHPQRNPLSADLDVLFERWVGPARIGASDGAVQDVPDFDLTDMDQFMPLRSPTAGYAPTFRAQQLEGGSPGSHHDSVSSSSAPTSPARPATIAGGNVSPVPSFGAASSSAVGGNAWLSASSLVRSAGPLGHLGHKNDRDGSGGLENG